MRPFHWKKLAPHESEGSLWKSTKEKYRTRVEKQIRFESLDNLFSMKIAKSDSSSGSRKSRKEASSRSNVILDLRRANNIAIMLHRFKKPFSTIRAAIMDLDIGALRLEEISSLGQYIPSSDEIAKLKSWKGDSSLLGPAERFFFEIITIPRYKERLRILEFVHGFQDQVREAKSCIAGLNCCFSELRDCSELHEIMESLLAIGNYMNYGTSMGNASGFRIDALVQASTMKANSSNITLLAYLVKSLQETNEDIVRKLPERLQHLDEGVRSSIAVISEQVTQLKQGCLLIRREMEVAEEGDHLKTKLPDFLSSALSEVGVLESDLQVRNQFNIEFLSCAPGLTYVPCNRLLKNFLSR
jgi:diaphanous 1